MSNQSGIHLKSLKVGTSSANWSAAGFQITEVKPGISTCVLNDVLLKFDNEPSEQGIYAIGTENIDGDIDGLKFFIESTKVEETHLDSRHPNFVSRIDHLVVTTSDCDRTTKAFAEAGIEARRVRNFSLGATEMRQTFFWLGDVILELVGPEVKSDDESTKIWGLALISEEIEKTVDFLGDFATPLKPAVQPGRLITTIKTKTFGIDDALAVMTPHENSK